MQLGNAEFYGRFNKIMSVLGKCLNEITALGLHLVKTYSLPAFLYDCEIWYCNCCMVCQTASCGSFSRSKTPPHGSSSALDDVITIISRPCAAPVALASCPATSRLQNRMPDASTAVWSGTGILTVSYTHLTLPTKRIV